MIGWVAQVARDALSGKLKNLVLSCHGLPGYLQLGEGFNKDHIVQFAPWRGLVEKLWLSNCLVARIPDAAMQAELDRNYPGWGTSDGNLFCCGLAEQIQCYVVASTETQCETTITYPPDQMTSFEGLVISYGPDGNPSWSARNPSTWIRDNGVCVPVPN